MHYVLASGTGSPSGCSDAGRGQRHISPLIPLLFFPLVPPTSRNFLELPRLPFLLSHTSPGRLFSYLHHFLVLFPLFIQFLQLSLLILLFSYVLYDLYFSQTFTLFLLLVLFLGTFLCSFHCSYNFANFLYILLYSPTCCAISTFLPLSHFPDFSYYLWESGEKLFWGDPGTPGSVKVIAGDCQRSLEIVDNSTCNKNYNSH